MREKHAEHPEKGEVAAAFGVALRTRRTASGLTQDALAEAAGVTTQFVSMLERGVNQPSLHTVLRLAAGLGVAAVDLVAGTDEELRTRATK
ncbi:MAG TPA: helix-turn-helix transcriptional regulator [Rubricoccaceae bacterium]|jgi:transcriptional regulator with XRE-family HTH domain